MKHFIECIGKYKSFLYLALATQAKVRPSVFEKYPQYYRPNPFLPFYETNLSYQLEVEHKYQMAKMQLRM